MNPRIDISPYFKHIANYYWDHLDPESDGTIWDWLRLEYGIARAGPRIDKLGRTWISFPDESHLTLFLLRWA
jgi:hypothetical protein